MSDYGNWQTSTKYYPHAFNQVVRDAWEHQQAKIERLEAKLAAADAEAHAFRRQLVVISEAHPDTTAWNLKVIANSILRPSR